MIYVRSFGIALLLCAEVNVETTLRAFERDGFNRVPGELTKRGHHGDPTISSPLESTRFSHTSAGVNEDPSVKMPDEKAA